MMDFQSEPLSLDAVRVLGVLIEKELSTPDYYPMTVNSLIAGCNQKSSRDPVVEFGETTVLEALDELVKRRLAGHASVAGSRAVKYRHAAAQALELDEPAMAVLASLMLRGPETIGEIRSRTSRMVTFDSMEAVEEVIRALSERDKPLVTHVGRSPGQKGVRYAHVLGGDSPEEGGSMPGATGETGAATGSASGTAAAELKEELDAIRDRLDALEEAFRRFKAQFE